MNEEEIQQMRQNEKKNIQRIKQMEKAKQQREKKFRQNEDIKLNREQMIENVSHIIMKHIYAAELYINTPTQGASLFNESNFRRQEWNIQTTSGYASTLPLFIYTYEKVQVAVRPVADGDILLFMRKIFDQM